MPVRRRRASQRASILALVLLVAVLPATALAVGPEQVGPREVPEPRAQLPGDTPGFRLPFEPGIDVRIEQGWNTTFSHRGKAAFAYDFGLFVGTPVVAAARGVVSYVHTGEWRCGGPELRNRANIATIDHADGSSTQYGHLSEVAVEVGDVVAAGQEIGLSGMTGYTQCLPHLHFARQLQGGIVTQSVPVYFEGYADDELRSGEIVKATEQACELAPTEAKLPINAFCGTFSSAGPNGAPEFARRAAFVNFSFAKGPGGYWLDEPAEGWSARWSGRFSFPSAGPYTFAIVASGGIRVSVDGRPIVDRWFDRPEAAETIVVREIGAGLHRIDVEHYTSREGDVLRVGWGRRFGDD